MSAATMSHDFEASTHASGMPLVESIDHDKQLTLTAKANFGECFIESEPDFAWLNRIEPAAIMLDLSCFPFVNSVILGWLLRLVQAAGHTPVSVKANQRVVTQLRLLHLDRLVSTVLSNGFKFAAQA